MNFSPRARFLAACSAAFSFRTFSRSLVRILSKLYSFSDSFFFRAHEKSYQSMDTTWTDLLRFRASLTTERLELVYRNYRFEIRQDLLLGLLRLEMNCSLVQRRCVTESLYSLVNRPFRCSVHSLSFSSVNWSGMGPAVAMTMSLNMARLRLDILI